ncbi:MAG: PrgI family protein [Patescibacteria group bacterium]
MRFQVPQYIEVEDKIFGPLTFKQFVYIGGALGISAVLFSLLPKIIAIPLSIPVIMLGAALAFFKVNDRPFALLVEDFIKFHIGSKLYIWKKGTNEKKEEAVATGTGSLQQLTVPKLSGSKLKDLTFELDVKNQSNPITRDES